MDDWSTRASYVYKRTYSRPVENRTETWEETIDRVIKHQRWLWVRAQKRNLSYAQEDELKELKKLIIQRKAALSGRTMWLGGTEIARTREASQHNCAFTRAATVNDVVDIFWLLLQGCGIGFKPVQGSLFGFNKQIETIETVDSVRASKGGDDRNWEYFDNRTKTWTVRIGDSAEAWAKSVGKLLAHPYRADKLVLDFSEIRPPGERLSKYGWFSDGHEKFKRALLSIVDILNRKNGCVLSVIDILDIVNWLGSALSTRRSAQIALLEYNRPEWREFATAKKDYFTTGNPQRGQSNNSMIFWNKPSREELEELFELMIASGGSEPGIINGAASTKRAHYYGGTNPCAEILLPDKGFCNLITVNVSVFDYFQDLERAVYILSRANYRQTCVNLLDGILQEQWHHNNYQLRLTGVSLTGQAQKEGLEFRQLRLMARAGVDDMAQELGLPYSANTTTVKPEGTLSKVMDCTEGVHVPLGKYIFNNIIFSAQDPALKSLREANYEVTEHPFEIGSCIVKFPVKWEDVKHFKVIEDKEVNMEFAVDQLNRYLKLMDEYVDHNCSITVSYERGEVPEIIDWLLENWDQYVGVAFLPRVDPTKTAADLGFPYLPQEVVTESVYDEYVGRLLPVDVITDSTPELVDDDCDSGVCPIR